jgi:hypothetical protein
MPCFVAVLRLSNGMKAEKKIVKKDDSQIDRCFDELMQGVPVESAYAVCRVLAQDAVFPAGCGMRLF